MSPAAPPPPRIPPSAEPPGAPFPPVAVSTVRLGSTRVRRVVVGPSDSAASGPVPISPAAASARPVPFRFRLVVDGALEHVLDTSRVIDPAGSGRVARSGSRGEDRASGPAEILEIALRREGLPAGIDALVHSSDSVVVAPSLLSRSLVTLLGGVFQAPPVGGSDAAYRLERIVLSLVDSTLRDSLLGRPSAAGAEPGQSADPAQPAPSTGPAGTASTAAPDPDPLAGVDAALHARILAIIDDRLTDRELSIDTLAEGTGLSVRKLQRHLLQRGTTATDLVRDRRLDALAEEIRRGTTKGLRELATGYGFASADYVGRAFVRRFGLTMSAYRAEFSSHTTKST